MRKLIMMSIAVCVLAGILLPGAATAQEEVFFLGHETGVGARAIGMGGAFSGIADDYSAVYWNPAGLGQIRRMEMNIGFSHNIAENDLNFLGSTFNSTNSATRLNSFGFVFPVPTYQGSMVFAAGYNRVHDFDNVLELDGFNTDYSSYADYVLPNWGADDDFEYFTDIDDSLNQYESLIEEGTMNHFVVSGAVEVQKNFFLGASLNFISGKDDYNLVFTEKDLMNIYNSYLEYEDEDGITNVIMNDLDTWSYGQGIVSDFSATNLKVGALYRYNDALRLGATILFPTTYTITENWSETFDETYDDTPPLEQLGFNGEFEYKIQEPYSIAAGASFKLLNLLLSGGLEFQDWSQAKFKSEPPVSGITMSEANVNIKQNLQAVTKVHLGAEVFVPVINIRLRGGYSTSPSPYKYADEKPDKEYLTAGLSLMLDKQVMVDIATMKGSWEQSVYDGLTNTTTVEDKSFTKVVGTLSIRF